MPVAGIFGALILMGAISFVLKNIVRSWRGNDSDVNSK